MRRILITWLCLVVVAYPLTFLRADDPAETLPLLTVSANRFGPTFELVTLDIAGENAKLELPHHRGATDPFWSPDGRKLLYRSGTSGAAQAFQFDVERGEEVNLTKTAVNEHQPVWSRDGKRILFTSERTGNCDIFVMNADGSNPINLTNNPAFDSDPTWSPDGKRIIFGSNRRARKWRLYVMDADGSNLQDLLGRNVAGWSSPSWSPDGQHILYSGPQRLTLQVFVVNADGKAAEALTDDPGSNGFAAFSPDGRYIAYVHFDQQIQNSVSEGGKLMLYDTETLTHTPITPDGMRCAVSRIAWKPKQGEPPDDAGKPASTER